MIRLRVLVIELDATYINIVCCHVHSGSIDHTHIPQGSLRGPDRRGGAGVLEGAPQSPSFTGIWELPCSGHCQVFARNALTINYA